MSALQGIRVLELAEQVSGEYCGKLLSDFGAEIIKIERPDGGSPTRYLGPVAEAGDDAERSGLFAYLNTNKHSVTLDLTSADGVQTLHKLLDKVDVVVADQRLDWLQAAGLEPEAVAASWPSLVLCCITPFGLQETPAGLAATDLTVFHSSGWGFHTPSAPDLSRPPLKGAGRFMASYEAALDAALCVVAALCERQASQQGQLIDISMQAVLVTRTDYVMGQMVAGDMPVSDERTAFDLAGPAAIYATADGFVYIWMSAPAHWQALGTLLGNPEWMNDFPGDWLEKGCTPERVEVVRGHLATWLAGEQKAAISAAAQKLGLIMVPVNNAADLQACEQFIYRQYFAEVEHPQLGKLVHPTVPYRMSETPAAIHSPAPLLGQHTETTLAALAGGEQ